MPGFHKPWSRTDSTDADSQQSTILGKQGDQATLQSVSRTSSDDQSKEETDSDERLTNSNNDDTSSNAEKRLNGDNINITRRSQSLLTDPGQEATDFGVTLSVPQSYSADVVTKISTSEKIRSKLKRSFSNNTDTDSRSIRDGTGVEGTEGERSQINDQQKPKIPQV